MSQHVCKCACQPAGSLSTAVIQPDVVKHEEELKNETEDKMTKQKHDKDCQDDSKHEDC